MPPRGASADDGDLADTASGLLMTLPDPEAPNRMGDTTDAWLKELAYEGAAEGTSSSKAANTLHRMEFAATSTTCNTGAPLPSVIHTSKHTNTMRAKVTRPKTHRLVHVHLHIKFTHRAAGGRQRDYSRPRSHSGYWQEWEGAIGCVFSRGRGPWRQRGRGPEPRP